MANEIKVMSMEVTSTTLKGSGHRGNCFYVLVTYKLANGEFKTGSVESAKKKDLPRTIERKHEYIKAGATWYDPSFGFIERSKMGAGGMVPDSDPQ